MLAKVGDADSSVDNAAKVEQPGALPMAYDGAHPKESAMTPDEIRADIEKHVRRIAPPAEFLQRGKELIGTQGRVCLRWPGQRSCCKVVGQSLGGPNASGAWQWLKADRDTRAIVQWPLDSLRSKGLVSPSHRDEASVRGGGGSAT